MGMPENEQKIAAAKLWAAHMTVFKLLVDSGVHADQAASIMGKSEDKLDEIFGKELMDEVLEAGLNWDECQQRYMPEIY